MFPGEVVFEQWLREFLLSAYTQGLVGVLYCQGSLLFWCLVEGKDGQHGAIQW